MIRTALAVTKPFRYAWHRFTYGKFADSSCLSKLKDTCRHKPMLIVGNGPSLNHTPLDDFAGIPSIGMNKIELLFPRVQWRPWLIVCTNGLVAKQFRDHFVKSDIPVYLSWKCRSWIPRQSRKDLCYFLSLPEADFSQDLCRGVGSAGTVTYAALQFAYYTGADPVILFGIDHSFHFQGSSIQYVKRKGEDINHFDANYFKEGQYWGLPSLALSEIGYRYSKETFEENGRMIYDATPGGKLDIFPKISVAEAKRLCAAAREPMQGS